jgi:hypothetical protein
MKHNPLGHSHLQRLELKLKLGGEGAHDAFLRLIESRELRQHSVIRIRHLEVVFWRRCGN